MYWLSDFWSKMSIKFWLTFIWESIGDLPPASIVVLLSKFIIEWSYALCLLSLLAVFLCWFWYLLFYFLSDSSSILWVPIVLKSTLSSSKFNRSEMSEGLNGYEMKWLVAIFGSTWIFDALYRFIFAVFFARNF